MVKPRSKELPIEYRNEAIKYLSERINKSNSVLIMAIPGVGKSSFLRFLSNNKRVQKKFFPNTIFCYIDINSLSRIYPTEFYRLALKTIYEKTRKLNSKKARDRIENIYKKNITSKDRLILFEALKDAIIAGFSGSKYRLVIIVDRFNKLSEGREATFFNNLKSLRDASKDNFSYIFVSTQEILDIVGIEKISELYKLISPYTYFLKPMSRKDIKAVFKEHIPKNFPKNTIDEIEKISDGYPPFIVSLIQLAQEQPDDWKDYIKEDPSIKFRLKEIWDSFPSDQKDTLLKLARGDEMEALPKNQVNILIKKGAIKNDGSFFSKIFYDFVLSINPSDLSKDYMEKTSDIQIDESRNIVLKKGKELEKPLTNQEFMLLAHLLRNPGRICSRDEIAKEVWGEEAIEGVSDEAIDQVVSRLRSKIENNRNKPRYIITVRGRGFQYKG